MFPVESRRINGANRYRLFVFKDATVHFPFESRDRFASDDSLSTAKQRPRDSSPGGKPPE